MSKNIKKSKKIQNLKIWNFKNSKNFKIQELEKNPKMTKNDKT